jgi:hypothetical protein
MNKRTGSTAATIVQTLAELCIVLSVVRAVGMGLLIAGVFASRPRVDAGFPVQSHIGQPPLANLAPNDSSR